jgi:hypothetical protein
MKTFKLVSMEILENDIGINIPLKDGLIINKEDENSTWILEAYTELENFNYLQSLQEKKNDIIVQAVITKKENDPAYFQTRIISLKRFENSTSLLLEGHLRRARSNYSELLLESLIKRDLAGDALLIEFKDKMKSKPRIK